MVRRLLVAAAVLVGGGVAGAADDVPAPKPAAPQPKAAPAQPAQPLLPGGGPWAGGRTSPTALARMEEEAEVLEVQVEVKRAYVKAAEAGLAGARGRLKHTARLLANKVISQDEVEQVQADVDAAEAQVQIRRAEQKEVEVRLKHARKRLDDAKNAPPPAPGRNPFTQPGDRRKTDPKPKDAVPPR